MPVIGFLNGQTAAGFVHLTAAFQAGLGEGGFTEGRNVAMEYRWANGDSQRMRTLAEELIGLHVAVLVATGGAHNHGLIAFELRSRQGCLRGRWSLAEVAGRAAISCRSRDDPAAAN